MGSALGLGFFVVVSFLAASPGAFFKPGDWYQNLVKPDWTPPPWLFAPVWTTLYTLMGIAVWLVWRSRGETHIRPALALFFAQLFLNAIWSVIFFGWHRIGLGLLDLSFLWIFSFLTMIVFWQVNAAAGALLVPYLMWLSVAFSLNFALWRLNA